MVTTIVLILHGLIGVALLGAVTHQWVSLGFRGAERRASFVGRYVAVRQRTFTIAVAALYVASVLLGALLYPTYCLDVRIPFEEMALGWAVGAFELKEHLAAIGLAALPLYASSWHPSRDASHRRDRVALTTLLALIVWWDFLVGHVLNNIRGLA